MKTAQGFIMQAIGIITEADFEAKKRQILGI